MPHIIINTKDQTLTLFDKGKAVRTFGVCTAKNGTGQLINSGCTPLGKHCIGDKIGSDAPLGAVFVGRVWTGEIYTPMLRTSFPDRDWILSRILWLVGMEPGYNLGTTQDGISCDSHERYIYIHGTPDDEPMSEPRSHGCVRMRCTDVAVLFDLVDVGTEVVLV